MSVIVVGLEQRQAPLDLLERVAVPESACPRRSGGSGTSPTCPRR